jgi:hypothetical protein
LNFTNYIVVSTEKTELISLLLLATTTLLDWMFQSTLAISWNVDTSGLDYFLVWFKFQVQ